MKEANGGLPVMSRRDLLKMGLMGLTLSPLVVACDEPVARRDTPVAASPIAASPDVAVSIPEVVFPDSVENVINAYNQISKVESTALGFIPVGPLFYSDSAVILTPRVSSGVLSLEDIVTEFNHYGGSSKMTANLIALRPADQKPEDFLRTASELVRNPRIQNSDRALAYLPFVGGQYAIEDVLNLEEYIWQLPSIQPRDVFSLVHATLQYGDREEVLRVYRKTESGVLTFAALYGQDKQTQPAQISQDRIDQVMGSYNRFFRGLDIANQDVRDETAKKLTLVSAMSNFDDEGVEAIYKHIRAKTRAGYPNSASLALIATTELQTQQLSPVAGARPQAEAATRNTGGVNAATVLTGAFLTGVVSGYAISESARSRARRNQSQPAARPTAKPAVKPAAPTRR